MKIVKDIEDNMEFTIKKFMNTLTPYELAHLVYFFASKRTVREFLEKYEREGGCVTCLNALIKLGVVEDGR